MSANDIDAKFAEVLNLNLDKCSVSVYWASNGDEKNEYIPVYRNIQLKIGLLDEFKVMLADNLAWYRKQNEENEWSIKKYDSGSQPLKHEIEYLSLLQNVEVKNQTIPLNKLVDINVYKDDKDFVTGLRYYAIIVQNDKGKVFKFFRLYSQKKELGRSPLFGAVFAGGHFDKVDKPIFLFDKYIDCIETEDYIFIFNKDKFHKMFHFYELLEKNADVILKDIKTNIPIKNFDEFQKSCKGHFQKLLKLKNIANRPYFKNIKMAQLKIVIKKFDLPVEVAKNSGGEETLLFNPNDKWAILRLLDDDYLSSMLTGQQYEVTGKRQV